MKISFGIHLAPGTPFVSREDLGRVADLVKMAEHYGAEAIGTYDSAFIGDDAYVRTGAHRGRIDSSAHRLAPHQSADPRAAGHGILPRLHR